MDYAWKVNRLTKDKEALKNSLLNVLKKKPKANENLEVKAANAD
eukprot:CAMPEP_0116881208 /NCGR_PEP_ID=MMETSP0463-20121206/13309_1 /TAXON_ID=181622 /ORGANISM="Strombidinopsis sp, Strain SopsisLIS2011" /LENGTH=43 /DNA_ID= /DNA_START= /DNA_END= /DNA_ORIENTATION=